VKGLRSVLVAQVDNIRLLLVHSVRVVYSRLSLLSSKRGDSDAVSGNVLRPRSDERRAVLLVVSGKVRVSWTCRLYGWKDLSGGKHLLGHNILRRVLLGLYGVLSLLSVHLLLLRQDVLGRSVVDGLLVGGAQSAVLNDGLLLHNVLRRSIVDGLLVGGAQSAVLNDGLLLHNVLRRSVVDGLLVARAQSAALERSLGHSVTDDDLLAIDVGSFNNLLIDRHGRLNHLRYDDITLEDGLDLFDDALLDDLVDDRLVDHLSADGGIDNLGRFDVVLGDGCSSHHDGFTSFGRKITMLDSCRLNLGLMQHLCHLLDVQLLSLTVDDRLDFFLLDRVDSLMDDHILLDDLMVDGLIAEDGLAAQISQRLRGEGLGLCRKEGSRLELGSVDDVGGVHLKRSLVKLELGLRLESHGLMVNASGLVVEMVEFVLVMEELIMEGRFGSSVGVSRVEELIFVGVQQLVVDGALFVVELIYLWVLLLAIEDGASFL